MSSVASAAEAGDAAVSPEGSAELPPDNSATGNIIFDPASYSVSEDSGAVTLNLKRINGNEGTISAKLETADGSAKAGQDYNKKIAEIEFEPGQDSKTVSITINKDSIDGEKDETFQVNLNDSKGGNSSAEVTIKDAVAEPPKNSGVLKFSATEYAVNEADGKVDIVVNRVEGADGPLSTTLTIADGTATAPGDYTVPQNLTLEWKDQDSSPKTVSVPIIKDDVANEPVESFSITLGGGTESATVNITDTSTELPKASGVLKFSATEYAVNEADGKVDVVINRVEGADGALSTTLTIADGTATAPGDYTVPQNLALEWQDQDSSPKTVSIPIIKDDVANEPVESFSITLDGGAESATVNITDTSKPDDSGSASFSAPEYNAEEGTPAEISVTRNGDIETELTLNVQVGIEGDSAQSGVDYQPPENAILTWSPGEGGAKILSFPILKDDQADDGETINLQLLEGELVLDNAKVNIRDTGVLAEPPGPISGSTVEVVTGDKQEGVPGAVLAPFVIQVSGIDRETASITWTVEPADGGDLNAAQTTIGDNNQSSNTFTLKTAERVVVTAKLSKTRAATQRAETEEFIAKFIVNGGIADTEGLDENEQSGAAALDSACPELEKKTDLTSEEQDLLDTCRELKDADPEEVEETLEAPHEGVSSQGTAVIETANIQTSNINARLSALRSGARGVDLSGLNIRIGGQTLPGAVISALTDGSITGGSAGDEQDLSGRLGLFINGSYGFGEREETEKETGFEFKNKGITLGMDYRISTQTIVGGAVGIANNRSDFSDGIGRMELDGVHAMVYGTYYQSEHFYLDGLLKVGKNDFTTQRRLGSRAKPLQPAYADTEGMDYSASLNGGFEFNQGSFSFGPYGRLSFTRAEIDAYAESAADPKGKGAGSVVSISDQTIDSTTAAAGGQLSWAISLSNSVLIPQARFEWEHEFSDESREVSAQFIHDPSSSTFSITTDRPDQDFLNIGVGFSIVTAEGRSGFIDYETRIGQDNISSNWVKAGVRLEF